VTPLAESLSRTVLLMRDEFGHEIDDSVLLTSLTSTRVALIADTTNIASHSAQAAFVTAAMLMARSGHQVHLVAPDVTMVGPQAPLQPGAMIDELVAVGTDILPGVELTVGDLDGEVDLAVALGDTPFTTSARRRIRLNANAWAGRIMGDTEPLPWQAGEWPFGALAAAALVAGEAFKLAIRKLLPFALSPENTAARFAATDEFTYELAPPGTPFSRDLGEVDCVSGGAITNAVLYCLAKIPGVRAQGRIIEPDIADLTNLNRYMLLLRSRCGAPKAQDLAAIFGSDFRFTAVPQRYEPELLATIAPLAPAVIVGVDHIPTRWAVQQAMPDWLVVGATSHWSAMASFHSRGLGCAHCLHDRDEPGNGPIPTTACVSFWAGLLTATYLARRAAHQAISPSEQQIYLSPFRPESAFPAAVPIRRNCPTCRPTS
jgi:hypothetical protein